MEEILQGQDDRIKDQINKLKEQDDRLKEQDQVIRELMKKIEQLESRGILENENRYLRSLAEMPALRLNFQ